MVALKATNQPPKRGWSYLNNTSLISKMLYFPLTMKYSTMTSINSLEDLTGDRIRVETASGMTVIEWEDLSDGGKLLIDSWFLGLQCLARNTIAYSLSK